MPGEFYPYFLNDRVIFVGSDTQTFSFTISAGDEMFVDELRLLSTGAFTIGEIKDESGKSYCSADAANPIPSGIFPTANSHTIPPIKLPTSLHIDPSGKITVTVTDTSAAANTVDIVLIGRRRTA